MPEGRLLVCVSGGADSMALLHACVRGGRECLVVHCDFHLRGAESERDREFVESQCERLRVPLTVRHFDVPAYQREHGVSLEMACRELRYEAFREIAARQGCVRIVVAHNRDDNDETMLLNLLRGTGVSGLCGMSPDTGTLCRPMLDISRAEIEEFLSRIRASFVTDSSNLTSDFKRNFIRRELLPLIATRWPGVSKSLARTRRNLQECRRLCDEAMEPWLDLDPGFLPADTYERAPSRPLLLMEWLKGRGASPSQIDEMAEGLRPGRSWSLREGRVAMTREGLRLHPLAPETAPLDFEVEKLPLTPEVMERVKANRDERVLYYAGDETLYFRTPRAGERMAPMGLKGTKLVSDLLREGGVDLPSRATYRLCVDSRERVIWMPGIKRSRHLAVRPGRDTHIFCLRLKICDGK